MVGRPIILILYFLSIQLLLSKGKSSSERSGICLFSKKLTAVDRAKKVNAVYNIESWRMTRQTVYIVITKKLCYHIG